MRVLRPRTENTCFISLYGATARQGTRLILPVRLHPHGHHTLYPSLVCLVPRLRRGTKKIIFVAPKGATKPGLSLPYGRDKFMQQTTKYQFNLVDATDDFSPDPLNQNAQKTEDKFAEVEADLADLVTEVGAGGHNCRIAWGNYRGTGKYGESNPNSLSFDFKPILIILAQGHYFGALTRGCSMGRSTLGDGLYLTWKKNGVSWYTDTTINPAQSQDNKSGTTYYYVALGVSE